MVPEKALRLPGGRPVDRFIAAVALAAVLSVAPVPTVAAPGAKLVNGRVAPASGTTATAFAFSVEFNGTAGVTATGVVVRVADSTLPLALTSGSTRRGTWTGASKLPPGSWQVVFEADPDSGPAAQLTLQAPVTVTRPAPAPTPTPVPTPGSTPSATRTTTPSTPALPATPAAGGASPTPFGTTINDPIDSAIASPGGVQSPATSAAPNGTGSVKPNSAFGLPAEGLAAIGLLGAVAVAAAAAERRRRHRAATNLEDEAADSAGEPGSAVDDESIGSIEYSPPSDPPG
ncbi:MAG: hypothetical protein WED86_01130 [Chloroflexota bacterium]